MVVCSCFFSWPAPVLYGIRTKPTSVPGVYSHDCTISDKYADTTWPVAYTCFLFAGFFSAAIIMGVLYINILSVLRKHDTHMSFAVEMESRCSRENRQSSLDKEAIAHRSKVFKLGNENGHSKMNYVVVKDNTLTGELNQTGGSLPEYISSQKEELKEDSGVASRFAEFLNFSAKPDFEIPFDRRQSSDVDPVAQENPKRSLGLVSSLETLRAHLSHFAKSSPSKSIPPKRLSKNATRVAVAVSIAFILSYLPHLVYQFLKMAVKLDDQGPFLGLYNIIVRSYFLSSVINPVIYTVVRSEYREVMADYLGHCCCMHKCF